MLTRLVEVCRAGSACPRLLAHPDAPSPAEVYRPQDTTRTGEDLLDFLTSAQSLLLILVGAVAVVLFAVTAWRSRREEREERKRPR
ncbi:hypothetical protein ACFVWX_08050 [Streptomyces sp. NPDC058220]|uniref:hypothetical protein n=1 Tax=Streptomyces sp. NPDC058220 TaxID=3346387 RepID=UPI0036E3DB2C